LGDMLVQGKKRHLVKRRKGQKKYILPGVGERRNTVVEK